MGGPVVALVVIGLAGGGAVALARHDTAHSPPAPRAATSSHLERVTHTVPPVALGKMVYFGGPHDASTTFLPLGEQPQDGRTLSAQHAYDALVQKASKLSPIPATVRAYYGSLTDRNTSPMAVDTAVWGFAVVTGCVYTGVPPAHHSRCRQWEFVDARTGHDLGVIEQEVLPD